MKTIKVLLLAAVATCTFAEASAQLPPPPPPPGTPLHLKKPPIVRSRKGVVKRRAAVKVTLPPHPVPPPLPR